MLKATRFDSSSEVYYSFRSCYGSGHMVDPSIDVTSPISLICRKLIYTIQSLYENAMSAVLVQGATGEWFRTSAGVRQ